MFISKGSYGYGEPKNVLLESVEKHYLPVRVCKVPRFMGGSIGPRMEIFETSGLPIPMVSRLHQSNGYIKRQLQLWRAQICAAVVCAETLLTSAETQTTPFYAGQYRVWNGNMRNFERTYRHGTAFPRISIGGTIPR